MPHHHPKRELWLFIRKLYNARFVEQTNEDSGRTGARPEGLASRVLAESQKRGHVVAALEIARLRLPAWPSVTPPFKPSPSHW